ncbi:hypothetical protein GJ700_31815 [Duganella sp. FT92W]|uniref:Uncharacterized protein n=1 Tax=Pseudoduganella rivuli TaxID=2666085 RepID=A0A7X2LXK6_9BURK|nr:hypothetical protein [Pseudoduganella rivuli]MRV76307.1 hypothetical protein [Pseudoduganella rivuli]
MLNQISEISNEQLLELRLAVDELLEIRGLTLNVGELGEKLVLQHFNNTLGLPTLKEAPKGTKNVDALSKDGDRYSIKTALKAKKTGTIYPDSNNSEKQLFEYILIVTLSKKYDIQTIHRFSWEQFTQARSWDIRMNAWYIPISQKKLAMGERIL